MQTGINLLNLAGIPTLHAERIYMLISEPEDLSRRYGCQAVRVHWKTDVLPLWKGVHSFILS
jgi:hypothetical protein